MAKRGLSLSLSDCFEQFVNNFAAQTRFKIAMAASKIMSINTTESSVRQIADTYFEEVNELSNVVTKNGGSTAGIRDGISNVALHSACCIKFLG